MRISLPALSKRTNYILRATIAVASFSASAPEASLLYVAACYVHFVRCAVDNFYSNTFIISLCFRCAYCITKLVPLLLCLCALSASNIVPVFILNNL